MTKLTVVVPFHKNISIMERLTQTLSSQTNKNFVLVFVSDGVNKTERSGVLKKVTGVKNQFLFHQKHAGPAAACNLGLKNTKTEWVVFIDADDYVSLNFVECFYKAIEECPNINLVVPQLVASYPGNKFKTLKTNMKKYKFARGHRNKFYKTKLIKSFFLKGLYLGEDTLFYLEYLQNKISWKMTSAKYFYVRPSLNSFQMKSEQKIFNIWKSYFYLNKKYNLASPENWYLMEFIYKHLFIYTYIRLKIYGSGVKKWKKQIKRVVKMKVIKKSGSLVWIFSVLLKLKFYWVANVAVWFYKIYLSKLLLNTRYQNSNAKTK